jgi:DNA-binding MarR family transcriptional regulator
MLAEAIGTARRLEVSASTTLQALCILSAKGPQKCGDLAIDLEMTPGSITCIAALLEEEGYAMRTRSKLDRRSVTLSITDLGREAIADVIAAATAASWENLSPAHA